MGGTGQEPRVRTEKGRSEGGTASDGARAERPVRGGRFAGDSGSGRDHRRRQHSSFRRRDRLHLRALLSVHRTRRRGARVVVTEGGARRKRRRQGCEVFGYVRRRRSVRAAVEGGGEGGCEVRKERMAGIDNAGG